MRRNCTKIVCVCLKIAALMTLSSCADELQTESSRPPQGVEVGFYAGGAQTRTEMLPNGLSAAWKEGDQLAVWAALFLVGKMNPLKRPGIQLLTNLQKDDHIGKTFRILKKTMVCLLLIVTME